MQKSLAAAKKTLTADESRDEISGTQNPSMLDHLSKEFEQKRQNFDDDARAIIGTKSGHMSYSKQIEEFKRIKDRFEMWKKEYKHQLRETRSKIVKGVNGEGASDKRGKQSWWGKLSKRYK